MPDKRTFTPPTPVIGYTAAKITNVRTMPASGKPANTIKRTAPQGSTQLPNRPMQPKNPSRVVDPETEARELAEAAILLHTRTLLSQVSGVPLDQIHTLIS